MKLPISFPKQKKQEYFLTLILRNEKINAIFFEESQGKVNVLAKHAENFKGSIEEATVEDLLEVADKAISTAEGGLPQSLETVKTIFGVKGSWVEDSKIKPDYLAKLKKVSDELGLVPIGFLVIFEAIAYFLEKEEGAPITAILAETGEKFVSAALIKAGKIKEFKTSEVVESLPHTLDNILKHFTSSEVLPPRIIIFNGETDESQDFINHKWNKSLPFIHLPQVTTLPPEFDGRAVLDGAATQLGFELLDNKMPEDEEVIEDLADKDPLENNEPHDKITTIHDDLSADHFGFAHEKDVANIPIPDVKPEPANIPNEVIEESIDEIPEEVLESEGSSRQLPLNAAAILTGGKLVFSKLFKSLGKFPFKTLMSISSKGKIIFVIPALLILLFIILFFYFFQNKATVLLSIDAQSSEKTQNVTFSSDSDTDPAKGIIASEFLAVTEDGTVSTKATGKKEVGTNAKGTVTIFNSNFSSQSLSSGTTLSSSGGLEFTLDKNITVASASGDVFSGTTPGKTNVDVTAKKIGQEYNLPSNTKFSVTGSSSIAAKNDEAFSGGTKKEVTVVSATDIKKLREELPKNLEEKAKGDLAKKISDDQILLSGIAGIDLVKENITKKADEEASDVKLTGTVEYKGVSYKKSDSVNFANEVLKNSISEGTTIDPNSIKFAVNEINQDKEQVKAKVTIKGFAITKINNEDISKQISGKSFENAKDIISKYPHITKTSINLSFSLPLLPQILPFSPKNIKINTQINE